MSPAQRKVRVDGWSPAPTLYSNRDLNVAGTLFEVQTEWDLFDALQTDLAEPLDLQDFDRERRRGGAVHHGALCPAG